MTETEDTEDIIETCPACAYRAAFPLGKLGNLTHYRCHMCGWTFSKEPEE